MFWNHTKALGFSCPVLKKYFTLWTILWMTKHFRVQNLQLTMEARVGTVAVTCVCWCSGRGRGQDFRIMRGNNRLHVLHSAVGDLHITSVKEFWIGVVLGKMSVDEAKKLGAHVCWNIAIIRWVEPYYVSLALPSSFCCLINRRGGSGRMLVTTSFQGVFVSR